MAQTTVLTKCVQTRYQAPTFSKASVVNLALLLVNILYPWIIVYHSDGLWRKIEYFWEQPDIHFKYELMTVFYLSNTSIPGNRIVWTSSPVCNSGLDPRAVRVPLITNHESDFNMDGKYDRLEMNIKVPLEYGEQIAGVKLFLFFNYHLEEKVSLYIDSMIYIDGWTTQPARSLLLIGDTKLHQKEALLMDSPSQYSKAVFLRDIKTNDLNIEEILSTYQAKTSANSILLWNHELAEDDLEFNVNLKLNYAKNLLQYTPGHMFLIKWAWVQYFSIVVIFYALIKRIRIWIFDRHLADTMIFTEFYSQRKA